MPVRSWGQDPDQEQRGTWDTVRLGGVEMPGIAKVRLKYPSGIHKRKARGKKGAGLKDEGNEPRELHIELTLSTPADGSFADAARDLIMGQALTDARDPLDIQHELPNYFGITTVVIGNVDIDEPDPVNGWKWSIQAFEWTGDEQPTVKDQKKRPVDDTAAWLPYRDDGTAGGIALPSDADAAHENLPDPRAP